MRGPQRKSTLTKRDEEREKPVDPETIARRMQRSRETIQKKKAKTKIEVETHAKESLEEFVASVAHEKDKRLFAITRKKEDALLKLSQIYSKEEALIESTFHMRKAEYDLIAQQWTVQAEKVIQEREVKRQDEEHRIKMTEKLTSAEQMLKEAAETLQEDILDDPLRILGMRPD